MTRTHCCRRRMSASPAACRLWPDPKRSTPLAGLTRGEAATTAPAAAEEPPPGATHRSRTTSGSCMVNGSGRCRASWRCSGHDHFSVTSRPFSTRPDGVLRLFLHSNALGTFQLRQGLNQNPLDEFLDTARNRPPVTDSNYARSAGTLHARRDDLLGQPTTRAASFRSPAPSRLAPTTTRPSPISTPPPLLRAPTILKASEVIYGTTGGSGQPDFPANGEASRIAKWSPSSSPHRVVREHVARRTTPGARVPLPRQPGAAVGDTSSPARFRLLVDCGRWRAVPGARRLLRDGRALPVHRRHQNRSSGRSTTGVTLRMLGSGECRPSWIPAQHLACATISRTWGGRAHAPPSVFGWNWETAWLFERRAAARYGSSRATWFHAYNNPPSNPPW